MPNAFTARFGLPPRLCKSPNKLCGEASDRRRAGSVSSRWNRLVPVLPPGAYAPGSPYNKTYDSPNRTTGSGSAAAEGGGHSAGGNRDPRVPAPASGHAGNLAQPEGGGAGGAAGVHQQARVS